MCHGAHVEVRGHLERVGSLFSPHRTELRSSGLVAAPYLLNHSSSPSITIKHSLSKS